MLHVLKPASEQQLDDAVQATGVGLSTVGLVVVLLGGASTPLFAHGMLGLLVAMLGVFQVRCVCKQSGSIQHPFHIPTAPYAPHPATPRQNGVYAPCTRHITAPALVLLHDVLLHLTA